MLCGLVDMICYIMQVTPPMRKMNAGEVVLNAQVDRFWQDEILHSFHNYQLSWFSMHANLRKCELHKRNKILTFKAVSPKPLFWPASAIMLVHIGRSMILMRSLLRKHFTKKCRKVKWSDTRWLKRAKLSKTEPLQLSIGWIIFTMETGYLEWKSRVKRSQLIEWRSTDSIVLAVTYITDLSSTLPYIFIRPIDWGRKTRGERCKE